MGVSEREASCMVSRVTWTSPLEDYPNPEAFPSLLTQSTDEPVPLSEPQLSYKKYGDEGGAEGHSKIW